MKDINIKIWPELTGILSALVPLPRVRSDQQNNINIDLSNICNVNSTGLVIILIGLLKIINSSEKYRKWRFTYPGNWEINRLISKLGFFAVLEVFFPEYDLFWPQNYASDSNYINVNEFTNSLPVYNIKFNEYENRRTCLDSFLDWLFSIFSELEKVYVFKSNRLIPILHEMAKNSADHTDGNALLGIDLIGDSKTNDIKICFLFGDTGYGINQSIAHFIADDPVYTRKHRHLSLSDSYHYALGPGYTTKPSSGTNRGLGMAIIYDMARALELHLSVFDANSRGILSQAKNKTHSELRKVFYNVGNSVGFYYYGELCLKKR